MILMSFNGFIHKYFVKNKPTTHEKFEYNLSSLTLSDVKIISKDGPFLFDGSHTQKLSRYFILGNQLCLYFEYKIQGLANRKLSQCAAYFVRKKLVANCLWYRF